MQSVPAQQVGRDSVQGMDVLGLSRQLVVVVCDNWDATNGWLQRFELEEPAWKPAAPPTRVSLGRNGIAWGRGLHPMPQEGPQKQEGDGRSPAGVFALPYVFGKATLDAVKGIRMPYVQCTGSLECVDDVKSTYYNQIVDRTNVSEPDWRSFENMLSPGEEYRLGVVVEHNLPPKAGGGSCIFLHVWAAPGHTTSGCTAMALPDLEALVAWMDHEALPLLVQLPKTEYARFQRAWRLPVVSTNSP